MEGTGAIAKDKKTREDCWDISPSKNMNRTVEHPNIVTPELREMMDQCSRGIEAMKEQRNVLGEELKFVKSARSENIEVLIKIQGLLSQFMRDKVRTTYQAGLFEVTPCSSDVLRSIDVFRRVLLPQPLLFESQTDLCRNYVDGVLSRKWEEPLDEAGRRLPYRKSFVEWTTYFLALMNSTAWAGMSEGLTQDEFGSLAAKQRKPKGEHCSSSSELSERSAVHRGKAQDKQRLSSSSSTESEESGSNSDCRYSSRESPRDEKRYTGKTHKRGKKPRDRDSSLLNLLRNFKGPKEIIPPPPFDPKDGGSLKKFLDSFEKYLDSKYDNTDREKATQLVKYLKGSAKTAYDAVGGASMKYSRLKPKLLDWYRAQKVNERDSHRNVFQKAHMQPGESSYIYCLRLERMVVKAYKGSIKDQERLLKMKIMETGPTNLVKMIEAAQSTLAITSGHKLTWDKVKRLAEEHDKRRVVESKTEDVNNTSDLSAFFNKSLETGTNLETVKPKDYTLSKINPDNSASAPTRGGLKRGVTWSQNTPATRVQQAMQRNHGWERRQSSEDQRRARAHKMCQWCGRVGHQQEDCWERQGVCLACGSQFHDTSDCPKRRTPNGRLNCPICGGHHLGKDCRQNGRYPGN
mgnify:CR=1 FL=1